MVNQPRKGLSWPEFCYFDFCSVYTILLAPLPFFLLFRLFFHSFGERKLFFRVFRCFPEFFFDRVLAYPRLLKRENKVGRLAVDRKSETKYTPSQKGVPLHKPYLNTNAFILSKTSRYNSIASFLLEYIFSLFLQIL